MVLRGRRNALIVLVSLMVFGWVLLSDEGAAFAAAPEAPQMEISSFTPTSVSLRGMLNPKAAGEEGTYEFLYAASLSSCTGSGKSKRGLSFGAAGEEVHEEITGLQPHTTYTVCLLDRNLVGEATTGSAIAFTTSFEPEAETGAATSVGAASAELHGVLDAKEATEPGSYEFVYRKSASECQLQNPQTYQFENEFATPIEPSVGEAAEQVHAIVSGLTPGTEYTYCLVAHNATGQSVLGAPRTITTSTRQPTISVEQVTKIGVSSATVVAEIEPGGLVASYAVEYGTTSAYGSETTAAYISGVQRQVTMTLSGLQPGTEYHYRFVTSNENGQEYGPDNTFATYQEGSGLPDGRIYEMVTPPENHDASVYEVGNSYLDTDFAGFFASTDGDAVAYIAQSSTGGNGSSGTGLGNQDVASRRPQGGWTQQNVTPPASPLTTEYQGFSSDLSHGYVATKTVPPVVPTEAPVLPNGPVEEKEAFLPLYSRSFNERVFQPLTAAEPRRPANSGAHFGSWVGATVGYGGVHPAYAGSSPNGQNVLFIVNEDLLQGAGKLEKEMSSNSEKEIKEIKEAEQLQDEGRGVEAEALERVDDRDELYESVNGSLSLINVLPDGEPAPGAVFGGLDQSSVSVSHAMSADGSRIFWTSEESRALYVRENGQSTLQLSPGPAEFWTASADGKYAFYIEGGKLWRFDVDGDSRIEVAGSEGGVQGVIGVNETGEDGSYVYFVAHEALPGLENTAKQTPVAGEDNLYVQEGDPALPSGSRTAFIASLSPEESRDWSLGMQERRSNLTPDGHALVFASKRNLTAGRYGDEGAEEVYVYDALDGSLDCASCRPQASEGNLWMSKSLTHVYRWISENGDEVFFDSYAPLVENDVDGVDDVYEWARDGSGGCTESRGCIYLLSSGIEGPSTFLDASVSGDDAFFVTSARLVPQDGNENRDVYDARADGVLPVTPPQCSGTGCQGVPAPTPIFATPASVTFGGVGNFESPANGPATPRKAAPLTRKQKLVKALRVCRSKRDRRQQTRCERQARKRYGSKTARNTTNGKGR